MELFEFLKVLSRRKWLIMTIVVVAFIGSMISARTAKVPKEAKSILHFNFSLPQEVDIQADYRFRIPPEQSAFDFVALFSTENVIQDGIRLAGVDITTYEADAALNASVQVVKIGGEDERTSFIEVTCKHHDGDLAVALVNGVTDAATRLFVDMLTRTVTASRQFLEIQVNEYEVKIDAHEGELREFLVQHPGFGATDENSSLETREAQLFLSQSKIASEVAAFDAKISQAKVDLVIFKKGYSDHIPPSIKSNDNLQTLRSELLAMELDRAKMSGRYSDSHPVITRLDSEIERSRIGIQKEVATLLEEELEVYKAQRNEAAGKLSSYISDSYNLEIDASSYAQDRIEYNDILDELRIDQDSYSIVRGKLAEAVIEENKAKGRYTVDIVEKAVEAHPRREIWFKPSFRIVVALIGSIFFALILSFFMEYVSTKMKEAEAMAEEKSNPPVTEKGRSG